RVELQDGPLDRDPRVTSGVRRAVVARPGLPVEHDVPEDVREGARRVRLVGDGPSRPGVADDVALVAAAPVGGTNVNAREGRATTQVRLLEEELIDGRPVGVAGRV